MTTEFEVPDELGLELEEVMADEEPKPKTPKKKVIDPEDDRENWPVIQIDFEDGHPNYAFCGASGTKQDGSPFTHSLQVQRGVDVKVPPSIVNMLRSAKEARYNQVPDPVSGRVNMVKTERSGIPWHIVEKGKYIK